MNRNVFLTEAQLNKLQEYEGKRIYYLGNYYKFHVSVSSVVRQEGEKLFNYKKYSSIKKISEDALLATLSLDDNGVITGVSTDDVLASIQLLPDEADDNSNSYTTIISSSRNKIKGQEFDMFCIPFGSIKGFLPYVNTDENREFSTMNIAQIISSAISLQEDAKVYDVQLLPYCPCLQDFFTNPDYEDPVLFLDPLTEHEDYEYIYGPVNTAMELTVKTTIYNMTHVPFAFTLERITEGLPACRVVFAGGSTNVYIHPEITISSASYLKIEANRDGITNVNVTYTVDTDTNIINITDLTFDYPADKDVTEIFMDVYFKYIPTRMSCSIMFYPRNASFSGKILKSIVSTETQKVESNTSLYRLVSPNYQGTFDFNLAKNGGRCDTFNYYCTYKPYTPFIKVTPEFNFLYGADYNDNRGLICGGDFSLPRISGAWEAYQLNNKNFQNIFNRDIQNLDFMQSIEMRNQRVSGAVGIIADTAKGAGAGAYVGGVAGGVIGGALGGITSGVGYAIMEN